MSDLEVADPDARLAWESPELIDLDAELKQVLTGGGISSDTGPVGEPIS